jgi:predicted flap endonuclease-1-like 5' DNA nuclease
MDPDREEPTMMIQSDKTALYDKIIVADRDKDDLTAIEGVGEFLAKKLNQIGVFSYEQIGNWTSSQIDQVTQQIGYIPGRIEKDDWVGQAALLIQQSEREEPTTEYDAREIDDTQAQIDAYSRAEMDDEVTHVTDQEEEQDHSEETVSRADYQADNLKIVEGIGPKIEEILKGAGIGDLETLGSTDPGRLREIMEEAGDQYRMHNPYTWPLQARLAASGRWEEFDQYQEELKGGK